MNNRIAEGTTQLLILILMVLFSFGIVDRPAVADDWPIKPPEALKLIEMVLIKGGCYKMGDTFGDGAEDERPVQRSA